MARKPPKTKRITESPLTAFVRGGKKAPRPEPQKSPVEPFDPTVPSRAEAATAARSAELGLSAEAARGAVGDPAAVSRRQRLTMDVQAAGFGGDFVDRFKEEAREFLIENEASSMGSDHFRKRSPTNQARPTPGEVLAQAYDMAMKKVNRQENPKLRQLLTTLVNERFEIERGTPVRPIKSSKPREALKGNSRDDDNSERLADLGAKARERRPHEIVTEGITDEVLLRDIELLKRYIDEGDERKYAATLRKFEQRLAARGVQDRIFSTHGYEKQATADVQTKTREEDGRNIYEDSGPPKAGSQTEGLVKTPGNIKRDTSDISRDAYDVIANDDDEFAKFLERFSRTDQLAIKKALDRIKGDPSSDAVRMARGEKLRSLDKALSIEGMAKAETARGASQDSARRASQLADKPRITAAESEDEAKDRKGLIRKAVGSIAALVRSRKELKEGEGSLQARSRKNAMTFEDAVSSINTAVGNLLPSVGTRRIQQIVRKAVMDSFRGSTDALEQINDALKGIMNSGRFMKDGRSIEEQLNRQSSAPQVAAIFAGIGSRIRGGANTRRAQSGRNVITGKKEPPVRGTPAQNEGLPGPKSKAYEDAEGRMIPEKELRAMPDRPRSVELGDSAPKAEPGQRHLERRVTPVKGGKPNVDYVLTKALPQQDELSEAIDEFMDEINRESMAMRLDQPYRSAKDRRIDPAMNAGDYGRAAKLISSRIMTLTDAMSAELKKLSRKRVPAVIKNANQLEGAQSELANLRQAIKDGRKSIRDLVRYDTVTKKKLGTLDNPGATIEASARIDVGSRIRELEGYIEVLEQRLGNYGKAIAAGAKRLGLSEKEIGVAVWEAERASSNPLLKMGVALGPSGRKPDAPKGKKGSYAVKVPKGYVRSDKPLPEMFANLRKEKLGQVREGPTAGEFNRGSREVLGRDMSDVRKRGKASLNSARRVQVVRAIKDRKRGNRGTDRRMIENSRNLEGLLKGLS